jgi:hypothetical protein
VPLQPVADKLGEKPYHNPRLARIFTVRSPFQSGAISGSIESCSSSNSENRSTKPRIDEGIGEELRESVLRS